MATTFPKARDHSVSIGRVFGRAFSTMGSNPLATFGIAFLLGSVPQALLGVLLRGVRIDLFRAIGIAGTIGLGLLSLAIWLTLAMAVQGALVTATAAHEDGRIASIGECLTNGLRASLPLIALLVLQMIGVMIGFALLLIPGIFLLVIWAVTVPALVQERIGPIAAFGRSSFLTRGARWRVFGAGLIFFFLYLLAASAFSSVQLAVFGVRAMTVMQQPSLTAMALKVAMSTVLLAFWSTTQTSLYLELREWKDGPLTEQLSEIFA